MRGAGLALTVAATLGGLMVPSGRGLAEAAPLEAGPVAEEPAALQPPDDTSVTVKLRRPILVNERGRIAGVWIEVVLPGADDAFGREGTMRVRDRIVPLLREAGRAGRLNDPTLEDELTAATRDLPMPPSAVTIAQVARRR